MPKDSAPELFNWNTVESRVCLRLVACPFTFRFCQNKTWVPYLYHKILLKWPTLTSLKLDLPWTCHSPSIYQVCPFKTSTQGKWCLPQISDNVLSLPNNLASEFTTGFVLRPLLKEIWGHKRPALLHLRAENEKLGFTLFFHFFLLHLTARVTEEQERDQDELVTVIPTIFLSLLVNIWLWTDLPSQTFKSN